MLKRVTITGLGPHENFTADLNPRGTTVISGPSESGKTTILEAVQFALWGRTSRGRFPVEQIRDGHDQALVELVLDSGRVIRRTVRRSKSQTRNIAYGSMKQSFSSEKAFQEQLGELGEDAEALRLVLVPLAWTELVGGNARAFRDVLSRVLPPGDISAEVKTRMMERGFQATAEEAQATEKEVMAWRRDAKAELNQWKGRVATLEERAAELEASAEEEQANTELEQANYVLNRAALWDAHAKAVRGAGARLLAEKTLKAWEKRHKELGEAPTYDEGSLESARLEEKHARQELKTLMESATGTKAAHDLAVKALEEMIEALQQERQNSAQQSGKQDQDGTPQDPALIELLAELKMIRSMQIRVNNRTDRVSKLLESQKDLTPEIREAIKKLSVREKRIVRVTTDLATGKNK